jgi:Protein of unknown function (DUF3500)
VGLRDAGPATRRAAVEIRRAVDAWLGMLDDDQRRAAMLPFDIDERLVWAYTPGEREGLALGAMRPEQRGAAEAVLSAAMSPRGAAETGAVIALESVLGALEREAGPGGWIRRDPELYWFAVFGAPNDREPWSLRVGGHHVAIHLTMADGRVVSGTPSFLGANPAVVPSGPMAGTRTLPGEEELARALLATLRPNQRRIAVVDDRAPADILSGNSSRADLRSIPTGIRHDDLDGLQRQALEGLIRHYLDRARHEVADAAWERLVDDGLGAVTFAWAGRDEPGRGHYYAVHGTRFLIEYDNTQNGANHIHAVWRDAEGDWGDDVLAAHVAADHIVT